MSSDKSKITKKLQNLEDKIENTAFKVDKLKDEERVRFTSLMEISDAFTKFYERNYSIEIQHIDVLITISQTLVSFSITLFVAFLSIVSLNGNLLPSLIAMIVSSIVLVGLTIYRKMQSNKLNSSYIKSFVSHIERQTKRIEEELSRSKGILLALKKEIEIEAKEVEKYKIIIEK